MAMKLSKSELSKSYDRLQSLRKRVAGIREKAKEATENLVETIEVTGAAFAMGVLNGKTGGIEVVGVPIELGAGLGLVGLSFLGVAGNASNHLHQLGNGCLAAYATIVGRGVGLSMGTGGRVLPGNATKQVTKGAGLSDEEIMMASAMAQG